MHRDMHWDNIGYTWNNGFVFLQDKMDCIYVCNTYWRRFYFVETITCILSPNLKIIIEDWLSTIITISSLIGLIADYLEFQPYFSSQKYMFCMKNGWIISKTSGEIFPMGKNNINLISQVKKNSHIFEENRDYIQEIFT